MKPYRKNCDANTMRINYITWNSLQAKINMKMPRLTATGTITINKKKICTSRPTTASPKIHSDYL